MNAVHPSIAGFILFCIERRGNNWPTLYDEMCRVASKRLYQALGYADLRKLGLSLGLSDIDKTINMVETVSTSQLETKKLTE